MTHEVKQTIKCEHTDDCDKPDRYWLFAQYTEIYDENLNLIEIIPDESEPHDMYCTSCGEPAQIVASPIIKEQRKAKAEKEKAEQAALL